MLQAPPEIVAVVLATDVPSALVIVTVTVPVRADVPEITTADASLVVTTLSPAIVPIMRELGVGVKLAVTRNNFEIAAAGLLPAVSVLSVEGVAVTVVEEVLPDIFAVVENDQVPFD